MSKYSSYKRNISKIAPNIVNHNFVTNVTGRLWLTDVTEFLRLANRDGSF